MNVLFLINPFESGDIMENEEKKELNETEPTSNKYMKIKKFHFIMLSFFLVFITAGITTFALAFGDEKVVEKIQFREREEFKKLYDAFDKIKENYYEDVDEEALINGAINGMIDALGDPYSDFMDVEQAKSFHESISSSFEGIGAEIQEQDGYIVIVSPIKGSPAEKAGLKPNDKIIEVDGKSIQGMSSSEAVLLIRGKKGTKVKLTIQRPGVEEPLTFVITRDTIPLETVYSELLEDGIAKIQITSFSENTTEELKQHIADLKKQGMKGIILDIRQNPGGLLPQAVSITSMFVPKGEVIFQVEYKDGSKQRYISDQEEPLDIPVVVLIDGGSASASEILAGAVKEKGGIPLIGEKTFGKGTVQSAEDLPDGSNLKITTAKWLTPNGNWIHKKGIEPDYQVSPSEYSNLPYINPDQELKESDLSEIVKAAEQMLELLGFKPGKADGLFDEETKKAVIEFQKSKNIKQTGTIQGETTLKLMEDVRKWLEENDPQVKKAVEVLKEQMK